MTEVEPYAAGRFLVFFNQTLIKMKTFQISRTFFTVLATILMIIGCQDSRFESDYFEFAKENDAVEFKAEIKQVPDHVDDDMVYYCRSGIYNKRQVVYKGVDGKSLVLGAYQTTEARVDWKKEIPNDKYIAEIIVPEPDDELLYDAFQKAVNQQFDIVATNKTQLIKVLELNSIEGDSIGFEKNDASEVRWAQEDGKISGVGINMRMLSSIIERVSKERPVFNAIDDSQRYKIDLEWESGRIEDINSELSESGLELTTKQKEVEILVVDSADDET